MYALGWHRELPDHRDYVVGDDVTGLLGLGTMGTACDIREHCSRIESQGRLGSCVAQAVVGAAEYLHHRRHGAWVDGSRMFLYWVGRRMQGWAGDSGLTVRAGMKALRAFGLPPESAWPYLMDDFEREPTAYVFAYARSFTATHYMRLDGGGHRPASVLARMKAMIRSWHPIVFGFTVFSWGNAEGEFPLPGKGDRPQGGHAVMAVGFDDERRIGSTQGALLIRNSWGRHWGDGGYGWLPYAYVLDGLASDYWALLAQTEAVG